MLAAFRQLLPLGAKVQPGSENSTSHESGQVEPGHSTCDLQRAFALLEPRALGESAFQLPVG